MNVHRSSGTSKPAILLMYEVRLFRDPISKSGLKCMLRQGYGKDGIIHMIIPFSHSSG